MKFSERTVSILRNFSTINKSIKIRPGNMISTMSAGKSVWAKATVEETFEKDFALYDLKQFLNVLKLFKEIENIVVGEDRLTIVSGKQCIEYRFADPSAIVAPPVQDLTLPSPFAIFELSQSQIAQIENAFDALNVHDLFVVGHNGKLSLMAANIEMKDLTNKFVTEVGATDQEFNLRFKEDNLKLMSGDYTVELYQLTPETRVGKFKSKDSVDYYIAPETNKAQ